MRILLHGYNTCCQNAAGGVQIRIRKILSLLKAAGIYVELFNPFETKVRDFDILHIFMLTPETHSLIALAKNNGVKVVISSIVNTIGGWKVDLHRILFKYLPIMTTYKQMYEAIHLADSIIVETKAEQTFLEKHYKVNSNQVNIIPNGIDHVDVNVNSDQDIYRILGFNDKYILQVGRFDANKNQLNVIKALKGKNIHVVFIGGPDSTNDSYYQICRKFAEGDSFIHFLGWVDKDSPLLKSAYVSADTLVLPSYSETFGMVALEAVAYGCKLVISNRLPILEYNSMKCLTTFDPSNINDIKTAICQTINSEKDNAVYKKILEEFSWASVIDNHILIYKYLIQ